MLKKKDSKKRKQNKTVNYLVLTAWIQILVLAHTNFIKRANYFI